jgi:hypothetical protein
MDLHPCLYIYSGSSFGRLLGRGVVVCGVEVQRSELMIPMKINQLVGKWEIVKEFLIVGMVVLPCCKFGNNE